MLTVPWTMADRFGHETKQAFRIIVSSSADRLSAAEVLAMPNAVSAGGPTLAAQLHAAHTVPATPVASLTATRSEERRVSE